MNTLNKKGHGFVLGKFMPLHKGHVHLIRFASERSERITVMVCSLPDDPIPGVLRVAWVRALFPEARVVHHDTPIPQTPAEHPQFWDLWRAAIARHVPDSIDTVFASETYGWRLAKEVGARFMPVDQLRAMMPISGTAVRDNPYAHWKYLPAQVRAHYVKRVVVVGPESAGKSTLVQKLAQHFHTIGVEEYARQFFDVLVTEGKRKAGEFRIEDLTDVAAGQLALEDSLAHEAQKILICDTDALTTLTWSDYLYGKHSKELERVAHERTYDLTLVMHPEGTMYVQDGQRVMNAYKKRLVFTEMLLKRLKKAGRSYTVLRGSYDERFAKAVTSIESLLNICPSYEGTKAAAQIHTH